MGSGKARDAEQHIAAWIWSYNGLGPGVHRRACRAARLRHARPASVTKEEVDAFYQASKSRWRGEEATIRQNVRARLQQQKVAARRKLFVELVRSQVKILVRL